MMVAFGAYDPTICMFVDPPHELDLGHLRFFRWLAVRGRLEHAVSGPSAGAMAWPYQPDPESRPAYSGKAS